MLSPQSRDLRRAVCGKWILNASRLIVRALAVTAIGSSVAVGQDAIPSSSTDAMVVLGKLHLAYAGFADYNTQKGKDSFGTQTVPEFLVRSTISFDAGQFLFRRAQCLDLSAGLWYWHNEYGKPSSIPGAKQATPFIGVVYHLDGGRAARKR